MFYLIFLFGAYLSFIAGQKKVSSFLFMIFLLILAFLRYGFGADYFAYEYLFNRLSTSALYELKYGLDGQEPLFRAFGAFLKGRGFSYQLYISLIALIQLYFIWKICDKYSSNRTMSLFMYYSFYYLVWTFSGLRQGITLAIGMWLLLEAIYNKKASNGYVKPYKFIFIVVLLSLVHMSALVLIPLYYVTRIPFRKKSLIFIFVLSVAINLVPLWSILSRFLPSILVVRIGHYIQPFSPLNLLDFQSIARIMFIIPIFLYWDKLVKGDGMSRNILVLYILSISLYFIFKFSELTAARLSIYGKFLDVLIFPTILSSYKGRFNKLVFGAVLLLLCGLYFMKELSTMVIQAGLVIEPAKSILVPYVNIFNKKSYLFGKSYFFLL